MSSKHRIPATFRSFSDVRQKLNGGYVLYNGRIAYLACPDEGNTSDPNKSVVTLEFSNRKRKRVPVNDPLLKPGGIRLGFVNNKTLTTATHLSRTTDRQYKWSLSPRSVTAVTPYGHGQGWSFGFGEQRVQDMHDGNYPSLADAISRVVKASTRASVAIHRDWALIRDENHMYLSNSGALVGVVTANRRTQLLGPYQNASLEEFLGELGLTVDGAQWEGLNEPTKAPIPVPSIYDEPYDEMEPGDDMEPYDEMEPEDDMEGDF